MRKGAAKKNRKAFPYLRYVPCEVEPGMFSGEWLVYLRGFDPANPRDQLRLQLLVDQREVTNIQGKPGRRKPASGWLRVALTAQSKGLAKVVLPQPAIPVGDCVLIDAKSMKQDAGV